MKKVLYLLDNNINTIGGSQKSVKTIISEMNSAGYTIGIFMPEKSGESKTTYDNHYTYLHSTKLCNSFSLYTFSRMINLLRCIKKFKPDIIHAQNPQIGIILGFLKKCKLINKKVKCIFTDRGFFDGYSNKYQKVFKYIGSGFDLITTTTNINLTRWSNNVNVKNICCISNVLDDEWFEYIEAEEKKIKEKYNVKKRFNIGFAARYEEYKRWDTVYEICKKLKNNTNIFFTVVITADNNDYREKMNAYLEDLKGLLGDKLLVLIDANVEEMKQFYYSLDAFILTSDMESFGRTILEAMTKNNLVFGTNSGGVPDIIKDKSYLFEVGDSSEVVKKLEYFYKNQNEIAIEKEKNRNYVFNNYRKDVIRKKLDKVYKQI